jgi:hypothetical protein
MRFIWKGGDAMNVRSILLLPLTFLIAFILPTMVFAEKPETKGKPVEEVMVQKNMTNASGNSNNHKADEKRNVNASISEEKSQNIGNPNKPKVEKNNQLPKQANEKAKEAQLNTVEKKQDKEKKTDPVVSNNKGSNTKKDSDKNKQPKAEEKIVPVKKAVDTTIPETPKDAHKEVISPVDNTKPEDNLEDEAKHDMPIPLHEKETPEVHISPVNPSGKNVGSSSADQKGSSKSMVDFMGGILEEIRVNFLEPFVMRQHVYRSQWVNAPPAPPPEIALSF